MKFWIEKDGVGYVYMHTKEPEPVPDDDQKTWESKGEEAFYLTGPVGDFFCNRLKKDTVAEFELKCIWERVENS